MNTLSKAGYCVFDSDPRTRDWACAAAKIARGVIANEALREQWLRHQKTWFVGVDALPNEPSGAISGVPLAGPWQAHIEPPTSWHRAQISVVFPSYPKQDEGESDANHRFRIARCAAHVDGILLENGRRYLREPHRFVLGLPLGSTRASPLVVWPQSHVIIGDALRAALAQDDPCRVDITQAYKAARREVFEKITPVEVHASLGQSVLAHRHLLHGVAPWKATDSAPANEGRMIAYFRPQYAQASDWLSEP